MRTKNQQQPQHANSGSPNTKIQNSKSTEFLKVPSSNGLKKSASKANDLSANYQEHFWDIKKLVAQHPESRIDIEKPDRSQGLTHQEAAERLRTNGPNKLPAPKEISDLRLFLSQFLNLLWGLLFAAATLSLIGFFLGGQVDFATLWVAIILYVMIVVMCFISFWQEREARKVVRGFENLLPQQCSVIRDGNESNVPAENLVVGDVIKIKSGIRVPADARIIHCSELKLETSSITGESEPIEYRTDAVSPDVIIFESRNVAFNSSMCVEGEGIGLVIKTATDTIIGQIASMTTQQSAKSSRLEYQIKIFVKFLTVLAFVVGLIAFIAGGFIAKWDGKLIVPLLVTSFTVVSVAMIPEGMPATVTSILTLVARRLASKNVYLKRLDIVEALGSASIIASDKTGTLTKNEMIVSDLWYTNEYISDIPEGKFTGNQRTMTVKTISKVEHPLSDLLVAMTICNKASFEDPNLPPSERGATASISISNNAQSNSSYQQSIGKKKKQSVKINMPTIDEEHQRSSKFSAALSSLSGPGGSNSNTLTQNTIQRRRKRIDLIQGMKAIGPPSEVAMIKYAEQLINVHDFRRRYNIIFEIPFNSKRKYHLVIAKIPIGAPEIIISHCTRILGSDGEVELNEERKTEFSNAYQMYGENGRRVIGFAHLQFTDDVDKKFDADKNNFPFSNLVFIGICAIIDPPRDETAKAIQQCKEAGIKVFMVTGDHHVTAAAIARQIGLTVDKTADGKDDWEVIKGEEISKLSSEDWDRIVSRKALVFSRTTPEQKFKIVEECEKRGQIIAMTGDGVNDSPALKKADIGVGMGSGSDVAKQAADIVLVDDNFSSMVNLIDFEIIFFAFRAVEEGRLMFDNIKKLMVYVLTHALPELWALFVHYLFGMPLGITTLQILSIDLGTEILPGIALCKEPLEGDVMKRPPRKTGKILIGKALIAYVYGYVAHLEALACFLAYMSVFWSYGIGFEHLYMSESKGYFIENWRHDPNTTAKVLVTRDGTKYTPDLQEIIGREAKSAWQIGIVFGQCFHIFSARSLRISMFQHGFFSNRFMVPAVIAEIVLLACFVYLPGLNWWLGGSPTGWLPWAITAFFGIFIFFFNEARKWACRNFPDNNVVRFFKF
ncbi:Cation-ATPase-N domain-containing protein [Aphelenchoides bicaudatus]|nr:Cation-ATPase-N domain-containing protein [Aphelenchoides bicaudatus]